LAFDEEGRSPFLIERALGEGKILLFASSADLDWNNLPIQTVYLPLINRSVENLAGPRGLAVRPGFLTGEDLLLSVENLMAGEEVTVATPGGSRGLARVERSGQAVYRNAETPGFYDFFPGGGEVAVPVNVPGEESDIRLLSPEELASLAGVLPVEVIESLETGLGEESLKASMDLTNWFFFALLCLLMLEGLMSSGVRRLMEGGKA
jgi:hypothetical protein